MITGESRMGCISMDDVRVASPPETALLNALKKYRLPRTLKERLVQDALGGGTTYRRLQSIDQLEKLPPNSSYTGTCVACCHATTMVQAGYVGLLQDDEDFFFLAPGFHSFPSCGVDIRPEVQASVVNTAVQNGPTGFITIQEGYCGVMMVGADFRLLPPGTYQWNSPTVRYLDTVDVTKNDCRLGPYSLITVPEGDVAVTFNNGDLVILGSDADSRTFFLDDPRWTLRCFLSLKQQTDRLEGNDLLSRDNVELLMVAWSHWQIVDPVLAVTRCATKMEEIRTKVNALVRAAIARIVAGTNIGSGPVSGGTPKPMVVGEVVGGLDGNAGKTSSSGGATRHPGGGVRDEDATLAHLMQSEQATRHMAELSAHVQSMGVEVLGVYVPEKRMKNDDIRTEVAKQAVIGIKAEAERSAADAQAYATVASARAQAEAIAELAKAHADAGARLGEPQSTASRLALTETMSKAVSGANLTVFSGGPSQMAYMLSDSSSGTGRMH